MHAVTKMADLTKFCQTEWSFMDLTILDFDECWPFLLLHAFLDISDKVLKMANLTKFCETEWMFTDLTILANFSQTRKSEIRLSKVTIFDEFGQISHTESAWWMTILTNFGQIRHTEISLADDDFDEFWSNSSHRNQPGGWRFWRNFRRFRYCMHFRTYLYLTG